MAQVPKLMWFLPFRRTFVWKIARPIFRNNLEQHLPETISPRASPNSELRKSAPTRQHPTTVNH